MPDPYPTFDRCPECGAMLWSTGDAIWCSDCEYSITQTSLNI